MNKFGEPRCMFAGSLLSSVGLACSFLSTSIPFLVASIGVFSGELNIILAIWCLKILQNYFSVKNKK